MAEGGGSVGDMREREEVFEEGRFIDRFFMFRTERDLCG